MKKEHLQELIEITTQLKNLQDFYPIEVDRARELLEKNELDCSDLEYKSVEMINFFVDRLVYLVDEIIKDD